MNNFSIFKPLIFVTLYLVRDKTNLAGLNENKIIEEKLQIEILIFYLILL